jgi:hypothetical protein
MGIVLTALADGHRLVPRAFPGAPAARHSARLCVAGLLVALAANATGGCTVTTQPNGTTVCGVHFGTGADTLVGIPVDPHASPPAGPTPTVSQLPAQRGDLTDAVLTSDEWVRTSPSCDTGATVAVDPVGNAGLDRLVRARDGGITLIILHITAPVTVSSWIGGRFAGSLRLKKGP